MIVNAGFAVDSDGVAVRLTRDLDRPDWSAISDRLAGFLHDGA